MYETTSTVWTPEAVNDVVENTAKCVAAAAVIITVVKHASSFLELAGRDITLALVQRKLYSKLF